MGRRTNDAMKDEDNTAARDGIVRAFSEFRRLGMHKGRFLGHNERRRPGSLRHSEAMLLFAMMEVADRYPEGISVTALSDYLCVRPPTITPLLAVLEHKGMLERRMDLRDRRIIRIRLLDEGKRWLEEKAQLLNEQAQELVNYLGEEKSLQFAELLGEVCTFLDREHHHDQR